MSQPDVYQKADIRAGHLIVTNSAAEISELWRLRAPNLKSRRALGQFPDPP